MNNFKTKSPTKEIYLDAASTTPPTSEVIEQISQVQKDNWGNPSNIYSQGIKASELLERSRWKIADLINAKPEDIIFTSGATESIQLAIYSTALALKPSRIVLSSVEHPAVISVAKSLQCLGWDIIYWPVDHRGNLKLEYLDEFLAPPTKILSLIWGQSEIGTLQPIELIGKECSKRGIIMHTDASQYISHRPIAWSSLSVDYLSASAHKFRGPRGIGLLLKQTNKDLPFFPLFAGGKQESGFRGGTPSVDLIAGMCLALEITYATFNNNDNTSFPKVITVPDLTFKFRTQLEQCSNITFTGDPYNRLSNHISMLICNNHKSPILTNSLVKSLSQKGIYVSTGSACSSLSNQPSHVLQAIKIDPALYYSSLRISLGNWITTEDVEESTYVIQETIDKVGIK